MSDDKLRESFEAQFTARNPAPRDGSDLRFQWFVAGWKCALDRQPPADPIKQWDSLPYAKAPPVPPAEGETPDWRSAKPWDYEPEFSQWMLRLTAEGLHDKGDIALAFAILERERDAARQELVQIREALAGQDYASLPSDLPTVRMAHDIRVERDKFMWQVRDTCARAETAERERNAALRDAERLDAMIAKSAYVAHARDGECCWLEWPDRSGDFWNTGTAKDTGREAIDAGLGLDAALAQEQSK